MRSVPPHFASAGLTAQAFNQDGAKLPANQELMMQTAEQLVTFGQGNVEALVESSQIFANGMQDISKLMAASVQATIDDAVSAFRAMTSIRSLKDAADLQANLARSAVEKAMTQGSQVAETSFKVTEQAFAPIGSRLSLAVQSFGKAA